MAVHFRPLLIEIRMKVPRSTAGQIKTQLNFEDLPPQSLNSNTSFVPQVNEIAAEAQNCVEPFSAQLMRVSFLSVGLEVYLVIQ